MAKEKHLVSVLGSGAWFCVQGSVIGFVLGSLYSSSTVADYTVNILHCQYYFLAVEHNILCLELFVADQNTRVIILELAGCGPEKFSKLFFAEIRIFELAMTFQAFNFNGSVICSSFAKKCLTRVLTLCYSVSEDRVLTPTNRPKEEEENNE